MSSSEEFIRSFHVNRIGPAGAVVTVQADEAECAMVAARLQLLGLQSLQCKWNLSEGRSGLVVAQGLLQARVTQVCVVTLEPFESTVSESFTVHFVLKGHLSSSDDPDEPDELIYDGASVELGEATVEQLALALDPYPRSPAADLLPVQAEPVNDALATLAKWRNLN